MTMGYNKIKQAAEQAKVYAKQDNTDEFMRTLKMAYTDSPQKTMILFISEFYSLTYDDSNMENWYLTLLGHAARIFSQPAQFKFPPRILENLSAMAERCRNEDSAKTILNNQNKFLAENDVEFTDDEIMDSDQDNTLVNANEFEGSPTNHITSPPSEMTVFDEVISYPEMEITDNEIEEKMEQRSLFRLKKTSGEHSFFHAVALALGEDEHQYEKFCNAVGTELANAPIVDDHTIERMEKFIGFKINIIEYTKEGGVINERTSEKFGEISKSITLIKFNTHYHTCHSNPNHVHFLITINKAFSCTIGNSVYLNHQYNSSAFMAEPNELRQYRADFNNKVSQTGDLSTEIEDKINYIKSLINNGKTDDFRRNEFLYKLVYNLSEEIGLLLEELNYETEKNTTSIKTRLNDQKERFSATPSKDLVIITENDNIMRSIEMALRTWGLLQHREESTNSKKKAGCHIM